MAVKEISSRGNSPTILDILNKRTFYIAQPFMRLSGLLIIAFVFYLQFVFNDLGADNRTVSAWITVHLLYVILLEWSKKFMAEQYDQDWFRLLRIAVNLVSFTWLMVISQTADHLLAFTFWLPLVVSVVYFKNSPMVPLATGGFAMLGILLGGVFYAGQHQLSLLQVFVLLLALGISTLGIRKVYNSHPSRYGDLSDLSHDLHEILDLKLLLQELARLSQLLTNAKQVLVFVINPNTQEYILHTSYNLKIQKGSIITELIHLFLARINSFTRDDLFYLDGDCNLYEKYFRCQPRSVIEVPFASREKKILGAICLIGDSPHAFDLARRTKILRFSRLVGSAVENCITYRTAKLSDARNTPMCKAINNVEDGHILAQVVIDETKRIIKQAQEVVLHLYEPSTERLRIVDASDPGTLLPWAASYTERKELGKSTMPLGSGIAGMALKLNEPVLAYDVEEHPWFLPTVQNIKFRSLLSVPIVYPGSNTLYGTISVHHEAPNAFSLRDEIELMALASNVANQLSKIAQYNSWREQGGQFKKIFDEVRLLDIKNGGEILCSQIVQAAVRVLPFRIARLRLLNQRTNELVNVAVASRDGREWGKSSLPPLPLDIIKPFLKDEYMAARAYLIPHEDEDWRKVVEKYFYIPAELNEKKAGWHSHDALLVPLRSQSDQWVGLLTLDVPEDGKRPSTVVLEDVSIYGGAVAWAIDLAKTHQQIDINQQRTMELIKSISEKLGRLKDIQAIGEMAVQVGVNIFRVEGCSFHLVDPTGTWLELTNSNYLSETKQINRKKRISSSPKCGLTAFVAATGELIFSTNEDYKTHPSWASDSEHITFLKSGKVKSIILMPITSSRGETLGVLSLENKLIDEKSIDNFDKVDLDEVKYLAGELGKAIELVRRYEAIEKWEQQGVEDDLHELLNWYKFGVVEEIENLNILLREGELEEAKPLNDKILNRAHTAMLEIKTLHTSMKRKYQEREKLKNALEEMVDAWKALFREQDRQFKIIVECPETIDLPDFVKNTLLRIAAHALTNCFKHSGMKEDPNIKANICVQQKGPNVILQVSDTGKGMERLIRGYGIKRMEQLVQKLNGKNIPTNLKFDHPIGKGTTVTVDLYLERRSVLRD